MSRYAGQFHVPFTKTMKILIFSMLGFWFLAQVIAEGYFGIPFSKFLGMYPGKILFDGYLWQVMTYQFLHTMQPFHILMNMMMLWFMGAELEKLWGSRYFLFYYLMSGLGAGIIYTLGVWVYFLITQNAHALVVPVVGASGSIFGLMLAYGILFGDRQVYLIFFPMSARMFVTILGAVEVVTILTNGVAGGEVANLAHLGGILAGYLLLVGTTWWKKHRGSGGGAKNKKKPTNLRLVVDNEKKQASSPSAPRYWN